MGPFTVSAVLGAAAAVVVGYFVYAAGMSAAAVPFGYWLSAPIRDACLLWAAAGALFGVGLYWVRDTL